MIVWLNSDFLEKSLVIKSGSLDKNRENSYHNYQKGFGIYHKKYADTNQHIL